MKWGLYNPFSHRPHEFAKDSTWLNTEVPLSISALRGRVVILDFWTYCCINCMHMLRTLSRIEERYKGSPVVVIGVHSAKFENERDPENIKEAIARYEIKHPFWSTVRCAYGMANRATMSYLSI